MWPVSFYFLALLSIAISCWVFRCRKTICYGKLPPGSMGVPIIGETIQFFIPSKSIDMPWFMKTRLKRYGPVFKTSLAGRPVVVSSDADFNNFILQQEGKLVELWYMDSFAELIGQNGEMKDSIKAGHIHKHLKKTVAECFGAERLKGILFPELDQTVKRALDSWTKHKSLEVKHALSTMILNFTWKVFFGRDPEKSEINLSETFANFTQGLMSFPLNLPGTAFHKCAQNRKKIVKLIRDTVERRQTSPAVSRATGNDFLDCLIDYKKTDSSFTDNIIVNTIFALLLATSETIPTTLTLAIMYLADNPSVLHELEEESNRMISGRENKESGITWKEYKSMTLTMHVINESLRMGGAIGILRRTIEDVHIREYVIPKGWTIAVIPAALHMDPDVYRDPLTFNPWRWEDLGATSKARHFIPFGGGMRSCGGADFSKALMAVFLHHFVTNYRWTKIKGGEIVRTPVLSFGDGYHVKVFKKAKMKEMEEDR
ncbi:hypothetical protein K2173_026853 [Erythroxylum novogranatense]|uniref:Cytochrome P450 n=1 Tax=Erythroxylum novogranatense TaxID=1862640 RepID=A0AAV8TYR0_9ROSI|nr:hypothetical protein K2173_026853 [Erythroxylum novogranatense]